MTSGLAHLVRRFAGSLSRRPPAPADEAWVAGLLGGGELALWASMPVADRRHAVEVARRVQRARPDADRELLAAALLHDVGKLHSRLGTLGRVAATVVGPRTARFRAYRDHEALGAVMAAEAGSSPRTVALVAGGGPPADAALLQSADDDSI